MMESFPCASQKECAELEEFHKTADRKLRDYDVSFGRIISELSNEIQLLRERMIEKDRLCIE